MNNINYENILYSSLSQEANFFINKKILAQVGLNQAAFLSFLIDKSRYHKNNNELTEDGYFFVTNEDIHLFTGLPLTSISKVKKEGEKLGLFYLKKLENSFKTVTYYKLNFEKILSLLSMDKSILELAYERVLPEEETQFTESTLLNFSVRELRLLCKKLKITYSGRDLKIDLINNILKKTIDNKGSDWWTEKVITNKKDENSSLVDRKSDHQWTEKVITGDQKNCHKKNQIKKNQIQKNQIKRADSLEIFEKLFKEFNVTFTKTNQASVKKLLLTMKENDVILYLRETFNNIKDTPNVKSIARLFSSKIAKGERQINSNSSKNLKKQISVEKEQEENNIIPNTFFVEKEDINFETYKLSENEEREILEKLKIDEAVNYEFILNLKKYNEKVYYSTLIKYKKGVKTA